GRAERPNAPAQRASREEARRPPGGRRGPQPLHDPVARWRLVEPTACTELVSALRAGLDDPHRVAQRAHPAEEQRLAEVLAVAKEVGQRRAGRHRGGQPPGAEGSFAEAPSRRPCSSLGRGGGPRQPPTVELLGLAVLEREAALVE